MLVQTDTRRRITLPSNAGIKPGDALNLEILEDGRIVLIPVETDSLHRSLHPEPSFPQRF